MKQSFKQLGAVAVLGLLAASVSALQAGTASKGVDIQSEENGTKALLDTLVTKGVITDQESEEINEKITKDQVTSPFIKFNNNLGIKNLALFGDIRIREEVRSGITAASAPGSVGNGVSGATTADSKGAQTRQRERYRARFGIKADLADNWIGVIRAATTTDNRRSSNVTTGGVDGPFGRNGSFLSLDQVYLGYKPISDLTLVIGEQPNPLYTTNMVWSGDLNPWGLSEQYDHRFSPCLEVFGNFLQSQYVGASTNGNTHSNPFGTTAAPGSDQSDIFLMAEQIGAQYNFCKTTYVKAGATLYNYTGNNSSGLAGTSNGIFGATAIAANTNGDGIISSPNVFATNNLEILEIPAEFDFTAWKTPFKLYGNFAENLYGDDRAKRAGFSNRAGSDSFAYQAGLQVGKAKKKGDWEAKAYWTRIGTFAVDPNLLDGDLFDGRTNVQGVVLTGSYYFTNAICATASLFDGAQIDSSMNDAGTARMETPGAQDLSTSSVSQFYMVQADLCWKF